MTAIKVVSADAANSQVEFYAPIYFSMRDKCDAAESGREFRFYQKEMYCTAYEYAQLNGTSNQRAVEEFEAFRCVKTKCR